MPLIVCNLKKEKVHANLCGFSFSINEETLPQSCFENVRDFFARLTSLICWKHQKRKLSYKEDFLLKEKMGERVLVKNMYSNHLTSVLYIFSVSPFLLCCQIESHRDLDSMQSFSAEKPCGKIIEN